MKYENFRPMVIEPRMGLKLGRSLARKNTAGIVEGWSTTIMKEIIEVLRDAILDNNLLTLKSLNAELASLLKANSVGEDLYGIFAKFKYEDHSFRLRYIATEKPFWMAEFLTTQEFYELVFDEDPSSFEGMEHPVENVNFNDAMEFCNNLNSYFQIPEMRFDLPTEEEWLAAKPYDYLGISLENDEDLQKVAWFKSNSNNSTQPVGKLQSNINGIYDMLGNVSEWTGTDHDRERKVIRGGSWLNPAWFLRCSNRFWDLPWFGYYFLGFRVVLRTE